MTLGFEPLSPPERAEERATLYSLLEQNIDWIFVTLSAVILLGGLAIFPGAYAGRKGLKRGVWILLGFCALLLIAAFLLTRVGYMFWQVSDNVMGEYLLLTLSGMYLLSFAAFLLRIGPRAAELGERPDRRRVWVFLLLFFLLQLAAALYLILKQKGAVADPLRRIFRREFFLSLREAFGDGYAAGNRASPLWNRLYALLGREIPESYFRPVHWAAFVNQTPASAQAFRILLAASAMLSFLALLLGLPGGLCCRIVLALLLLFSVPYCYALAGGSLAPLAASCVLFFLALRNARSALLRELSLLVLAFASALSPVLALFGLLPFLERRWWAGLRWLLYTLVLFVFSFTLWGGTENIPLYFSNLAACFSLPALSGRMAAVNPYSLIGALSLTGEIVTGIRACLPIYAALAVLLALLLLICAFTLDGWKRIACLCLLAVGLQVEGSPGTAVYLVLPLCAFLAEPHSREFSETVYLFLFLCLFGFFPAQEIQPLHRLLLVRDFQTVNCCLTEVVHSLAQLVLGGMLIGEGLLRPAQKESGERLPQ